MRSVPHDSEAVYVGLDVHKDSITAGVLGPGRESPEVERFFHDEVSIRRFVGRLGDRKRLRVCYEAARPGSNSPGCSRRCGSSVWWSPRR